MSTKNVYIIHGAYGNPDENWSPWLKSELERRGYRVTVPTFPTPDGQNFGNWMKVIEAYLSDFNEEAVLIGHSIGATFTLAILEKLTVEIQKTILVSGFVGPLGLELDAINTTIAEREFEWDVIRSRSRGFVVLHGTEDPYVSLTKAEELGQLLNTEPIVVPQGSHLNAAAGFNKFPLLLDKVFGLTDIKPALEKSWSAATSYSPDEWLPKNAARGQCAVTALVVQDYMGGDIIKCGVVGDGDSHYYNKLPNGDAIDLTRSQFQAEVTFGKEQIVGREQIFAHSGTAKRYNLLKSAVTSHLEAGNVR